MDGNAPDDGPLEKLDARTERFAKAVRAFVRKLPRTVSNAEDVKQLVRASGSVAANFIEATEAVSKKDYLLRLKYSRKEAKESRLFLALVDVGDKPAMETERLALRAAVSVLASNKSAIASACARSILSLRKARCVNSPGRASLMPIDLPASIQRDNSN